jgi:hypothetical protein
MNTQLQPNNTTKQQLKDAAGKCWQAISTSDAPSHVERLANGYRVRAVRSYHRRPVRVAWSPRYDLIAPDGSMPVSGQPSATSLAHVAFIYLSRLAAQRSAA